MITLMVLTCLNVNGGWWCSKEPTEISFSRRHYSVVLKSTSYNEVKSSTEGEMQREVVFALYGRDGDPRDWDARMKDHPKRQGCEIKFASMSHVSAQPCSKLRKKFR